MLDLLAKLLHNIDWGYLLQKLHNLLQLDLIKLSYFIYQLAAAIEGH